MLFWGVLYFTELLVLYIILSQEMRNNISIYNLYKIAYGFGMT